MPPRGQKWKGRKEERKKVAKPQQGRGPGPKPRGTARRGGLSYNPVWKPRCSGGQVISEEVRRATAERETAALKTLSEVPGAMQQLAVVNASILTTSRIKDLLKTLSYYAHSGGCPLRTFLEQVDKIKDQLIVQGLKKEYVEKAVEESQASFKVMWSKPPRRALTELEKTRNVQKWTDPQLNSFLARRMERLKIISVTREEPKPVKEEEACKLPCEECSRSCCSNCLLPFKPGDKKVRKIFSEQLTQSKKLARIPLEMAIFCIFDPSNPYRKWREGKMSAHSSCESSEVESDLEDEAVVGNSDDGTGASKVEEDDVNKETVKEKQDAKDDEDPADGDSDTVDAKPVQLNPSPSPLKKDDVKDVTAAAAQKLQALYSEIDEKERLIKVRNKKIVQTKREMKVRKMTDEAINKFKLGMPDFKMCEGCAELLSMLFCAWEHHFAEKLTDEQYFYAVMLAFKTATKARKKIFEPEKESKFFIYKKYSELCHPMACQPKRGRHGKTKWKLETELDGLKHAVGVLHSYMEESYRRVHDEWLSLIENEDFSNSSDSDGDEQDSDEGCKDDSNEPKKQNGNNEKPDENESDDESIIVVD